MRVYDAQAFALLNVGERHVGEQGAFANACFPDAENVSQAVFVLDAKPLVRASVVGNAYGGERIEIMGFLHTH